jgi:hypothetical protein
MPIKCAGAPQKAMYLSCDHWRRANRIDDIDVEFHIAGDVLFGVKEYVPALMHYIERYGIDLKFESRLVAVNGPARDTLASPPRKPRIALPSGNSSRPTPTAPIVGMRKARWLCSPQTPISWCT